MTRQVHGAVALSLWLLSGAFAAAQQPAAQQPPPLTNLQIYPKDIARQELVTTMQGFVRQLGVQNQGGCGYCHSGTAPQFDFASDSACDCAGVSVPVSCGTSFAGVLSACVHSTAWSAISGPYFWISL